MSTRTRRISQLAAVGAAAGLLSLGAPVWGADQANDQQLQRLMESASQAPARPDHDFAANSISNLLRQSKDLELTAEQKDKIAAIQDRYAQTKSRKEAAYQQSEMEVLKLIHDRHSSLNAVEAAVQKADQEHSKLRMAGITALREAADVLRPEQYARWRQNHVTGQVAQSPNPSGVPGQSEAERLAPH